MNIAEPRLAASLLMARDHAGGPEIYMVRRHPRNAFMANAMVFVGGRVDDADAEPSLLSRCRGLEAEQAAECLGLRPAERALAHFVAALRESFEEGGLLLAQGELPPPGELQAGRDQLNQKQVGFAELLARWQLTLPLDRLRYLDRWTTPRFEQRRFDTRFFVCRAPAGQRASHDPRETTEGRWITARDALQQNSAGQMHLAPPTMVILEQLAHCSTVEQMLQQAPHRPVPEIMSRPLIGRTKRPILLLPGDHRYDDPDSPEGPEDYVELVDSTWVHIRS